MNSLTKSQKKVFDFVSHFILEKGYSPTFRDIQSHFEFASLGSVYTYIKVLKRKGLLHNGKRTRLTLNQDPGKLVKPAKEPSLPFIGYIAAGFPIETFPQAESIAVPESLAKDPDQTYVLKAKGDTLIDEHILDGDLLIISARTHPIEGELIVAGLSQNETIVKRFYPEGPYIRLEGTDGRHQPIILSPNEVTIQGIVIGLIRSYS